MALKGIFGSKSSPAASDTSPSQNTDLKGFRGHEAEPLGRVRKMNRIDRPRSGSIVSAGGLPTDAEDEAIVSVGKQKELEADNAIQYRTCSWPKVRLHRTL